MNRAKAAGLLRRAAAAIESCPLELSVIRVEVCLDGLPEIQLPWDQFCELFSRAQSSYYGGIQYLSAERDNVTWTACRRVESPDPVAITQAGYGYTDGAAGEALARGQFVYRKASDSTNGVIVGDGGDDELALRPAAAHAACEEGESDLD